MAILEISEMSNGDYVEKYWQFSLHRSESPKKGRMSAYGP